MKEKILQVFSELGFELRTEDKINYRFRYDAMDLMCIFDEKDENCINITVPHIPVIEHKRLLYTLAMLDKINMSVKYVKALTNGEDVWLVYERDLIGNEDLPKVISRMIRRLEYCFLHIDKIVESVDKGIVDFSWEA